jgi:transcriptional antiterminator RfaH
MDHWYLVHTKPAGEATAQRNLLRQGYEVYWPRLVRMAVRAGRRRERIGALFPRYLFVRVNEGVQALAPVRSSRGVANVVRFGSQYAHVPERVVCDLRERADPQSGLHRLRAEEELVRGAAVRVISGPFAGLEGVFERRTGAERVTVLLTLLGQNARVHILNEQVVRHHAS